jgi:hypothetical protein
MDEKQNAINQIKAIHEVFYSGDRLTGSPEGLYFTGAMCVLLAFGLLICKLQEIGSLRGTLPGILILILLVPAVILSTRSKHSKEELEAMKKSNSMLHPLIKQSFGITRALIFAGFALTVVWWQHTDRIMALWLVLFGVSSNLWGRLIHKKVEQFSFVLIIGGAIVAGMEELNILKDYIVMIALFYMGPWSVISGYLTKKYQQS